MPKPDAELVRKSIVYKLIFTLGIDPRDARPEDWLNAAMFAARDLVTESFLQTRRSHIEHQKRMVYYLSMEFLLGRAFANSLISRERLRCVYRGFPPTGIDFDEVSEKPGLGNGGLSRLAACFLDSLATFAHSGHGLRHPLSIRHVQAGNR